MQRRPGVPPGKAGGQRGGQVRVRRGGGQAGGGGGRGLRLLRLLEGDGHGVGQGAGAHRHRRVHQPPQRPGRRVGEQGQQHPVGPAGAVLQKVGGPPAAQGELGRQPLQGLCRVLQRHGEQQPVPGPGGGHIEHPHLLADGVRSLGGLHRPQGGGGVGASRPGSQGEPQPQPWVQHHRGDQVLPVEGAVQPGGDDHRELQPLGAVHRHDGHAPRAALALLGAGHAALGQGRVHGPHHAGQAVFAAVGGEGGETPQVLPAGLALPHGPGGGKAAGAQEDLLHQPVHRQGLGQPA